MIRKMGKHYHHLQLISKSRNLKFIFFKILFYRNFFSQLEDERNETETRLERMSRDMEGVYQTKVTEKLQKLEENKQNVLKTQETYRLNIQQEEERLQLKREEFERTKREWEESLTKTGFADQIGSLT